MLLKTLHVNGHCVRVKNGLKFDCFYSVCRVYITECFVSDNGFIVFGKCSPENNRTDERKRNAVDSRPYRK